MYLCANINTMLFNPTTCNISEGRSEISLAINEKYFHPLGAIHGAVYFKLLDDASYFAVSSIVKDVFVLTTSYEIKLIKPVNHGYLKAIGTVKHNYINKFIAEATLYNEAGEKVAFGIGNFSKSKTLLSEKIGYR